MDEETQKGMRELERALAERIKGRWVTLMEMEELEAQIGLEHALQHAHWCQGNDEQLGHGWEHSQAECWGEEPMLRAGAMTCPECFSHSAELPEEPEGRGLGVPR